MIGREIYIETGLMPGSGGARKYEGAVAEGYDAKREESPKWKAEQEIVEKYLDDLPSGDWVLDIPVGTGRFLPFYHSKGLLVKGADISGDMLNMAARKIVDEKQVTLGLADVRALPFLDNSVDAAVMIRLTRWLSPEDCVVALKQLQRVARKKVIFTARVANHPHSRPYDLLNSAIESDWAASKDLPAGDDENYRVIMWERKNDVG